MKTNFKLLTVITLLAITFYSCSSDDDDNNVPNAPVIADFEVGEGGTHGEEGQIAYRGSDLHLEAEILAENTISSITVNIHSDEVTPGEGEEAWEMIATYNDTNYQVKNTHLHEHYDIPSSAPAGEYHVIVTVMDQAGNDTTIEEHITIIAPITVSEMDMSETAARGTDIHLEFMMNATSGIHNITVDIHGHDLPVAEGEVTWEFEEIYEDGYHGETEIMFHEHISVPATAPSGEYHVLIVIEDEDGNAYEYNDHISVSA